MTRTIRWYPARAAAKAAVRCAVIALAAMALGGCTIIWHKSPPADWPVLRTTVHHVKAGELFKQCYSSLSLAVKLLGGVPEGCAWIYFDRSACDIYVREDSGNGIDQRVLEHEHEHCLGKDHLGDASLADAWAKWRVSGSTR